MNINAAFELTLPTSIAEAISQHQDNPAARYVAGGTDLVPNLHRGMVNSDLLISLEAIEEIKTVSVSDAHFVIGAGVTLAELGSSPLLKQLPVLASITDIAGPALREAATIGGNLCLDTRCVYYNQSKWWRKANSFCLKLEGDTCHVAPQGNHCHAAFSGDMAPILLALDTEINIAGLNGERWQPLADLYQEDGQAHLTIAPNEILVAVRIPASSARLRAGYLKSRIRKSIDFPLAGVAVALQREKDRVSALRIALTGTNSRPVLVDGLEDLKGQVPDKTFLKTIKKRIGHLVKPMRTTNIPGNYRRQMASVLAERLILRLYEESGDDGD